VLTNPSEDLGKAKFVALHRTDDERVSGLPAIPRVAFMFSFVVERKCKPLPMSA